MPTRLTIARFAEREFAPLLPLRAIEEQGRQALAIHPGLDEVREAVRELEAALGETD